MFLVSSILGSDPVLDFGCISPTISSGKRSSDEEVHYEKSRSYLVAFLLSTLAFSRENSPSIGLGVSLGKEFVPTYAYQSSRHYYNLGMPSVDFPSIYIPITVSRSFRIEPEIGFWNYSTLSGTSEYRYWILRIGLGMFLLRGKERTGYYYGIRSSVNLNSEPAGAGSGKTDFFIGPALGGEYLFSKHFSLGGEAQLNFVSYYTNMNSESSLSTKTVLFLRWYF